MQYFGLKRLKTGDPSLYRLLYHAGNNVLPTNITSRDCGTLVSLLVAIIIIIIIIIIIPDQGLGLSNN
jgi:hypothetical protein